MEVTLTGENSLRKRAFVDAAGNFQVYTPLPGMYKLEVYNAQFYFEPVIVFVMNDEEIDLYPNKKQV